MADIPTIPHAAATLAEVHAAFRWKPANATVRTAINIGASYADDVGCLAWQLDDNSVWLAKAAGIGSSKWQQVGGSLLDIVSLATESAPAGGVFLPIYNGTTNKKATLASFRIGAFGSGTYFGELIRWSGTDWVVAADGDFTASRMFPTAGLGGRCELNNTTQIIGTLDGEARVVSDHTGASYLGVVNTWGGPDPNRVVSARFLTGDDNAPGLAFFDGTEATKQTVTGATPTTKVDSLLAALTAHGLVTNSTTAGQEYSGTVTTSSATTTTLVTIPLADNTRYVVELEVMARDTGANLAEWIDEVTWYRAGGGPTKLGGSKGPAPVSNISTASIAGAWVADTASVNNVVLYVTTLSISHIRFDYRVRVTATAQPAAV